MRQTDKRESEWVTSFNVVEGYRRKGPSILVPVKIHRPLISAPPELSEYNVQAQGRP